jgi:hypothetical protein
MIVNTPRGPKPQTGTSGASPAPAAGTAPANPTHHAPPANSQGGNPKQPPSGAFSAKLSSLPGAAAKLAEVKITASPAETPPTSLAPLTEAATPQAINAANAAAPATNGNEAPANTPAPVAAAAPPAPAPSTPEAEEPPPATSQSGSAAAQPKPASSNKPAAPATPAAPEPEEDDERDPHRREKELVAAGVRLALGDAGVRLTLVASLGGEVSRLLDRELKPIRDEIKALKSNGGSSRELADLKRGLEAKLDQTGATIVAEVLAEVGRAATPEQVEQLVETAVGRINGHAGTLLETAVGNINTFTETSTAALGGQVDAAKTAAFAARESAEAAAGHAERTTNNLLGVGGTLEQVKDRVQEAATAADAVTAGADRVADQLAAAATRTMATHPTPPTNPGVPLPAALGGGIGTSPVVGTGPGGQTVVAAGNPIPAPPPAGMHALHGPARDYQNVKVLVGGVIAIVSVLLAIIFL